MPGQKKALNRRYGRDFDDGIVDAIGYGELDHVNLTRDFLNNPEQFLRHL